MSTDKILLDVKIRNITGKKVKDLRQAGDIPAVIYGHNIEPTSVMAPAGLVEKVVASAGKHHPVQLNLDGKTRLTMIKSVDMDPVKHKVRHVSFHAIKQNEKVKTEVPIVLTGSGESPAERAGLIVLTTLETVNVEALPNDLPDAIEVSVATLTEVGDHLTIADLVIPKGVVIDNDPEQGIASVYEPSALAAANEEAGGDAEPEDVADVEAENGEDTDQTAQASEDKPGGKQAAEAKKE
ncbi:MAG TPA: 50S ribosomal protein L25 [Candidatus Saccharimonadales bacterium]|jgi:large subunit ribosomal protein L25|nr:50S ribosomal protein L25 [Candidatus Saccharimonadales bacterium]